MKTRTTLITSILLAAGLLSGAAHAALQGRDLDGNASTFEAYYDTDLDITWLADANYAKTSGYDADGRMDWVSANAWATNLSFYNPLTNQTYADWRLPTTQQPDSTCSGQGGNAFVGFYGYGTGCTGSEMGHLFYEELGGTAGSSIKGSGDPDLWLFVNLETDWAYWSGTEGVPAPSGDAWGLTFFSGDQGEINKLSLLHAWAVSSGDVAAVPEAQTYALMLAGLGLVGWRARRRG